MSTKFVEVFNCFIGFLEIVKVLKLLPVLKGFFIVSREYIKEYGLIKGIFISVFRIPLKFIQML